MCLFFFGVHFSVSVFAFILQKVVLSNKNSKDNDNNDDTNHHDNDDSDQFVLKSDDDDDDDDRNHPSCAVCLVDYQEGDCVSFSHNPKCSHHFHKACILEWLKDDHDECPCCRNNYLTFGDDNDNLTNNDGPVAIQQDHHHHDTGTTTLMDRLYQTGPFATDEPEDYRFSQQDDGPWESRLERTLERLRSQVEDRVQIARRQIQERRRRRSRVNSPTSRRNDPNSSNNNNNDNEDPSQELVERSLERLEHSISLVRSQLSRLRTSADQEIRNLRGRRQQNNHPPNHRGSTRTNNHHRRWEDAIQVVHTRLADIANSEPAERFRSQSQRALQNIRQQVSSQRSSRQMRGSRSQTS